MSKADYVRMWISIHALIKPEGVEKRREALQCANEMLTWRLENRELRVNNSTSAVLRHKYREIDKKIRAALDKTADEGALDVLASVCGLELRSLIEIRNSSMPISDMCRQALMPELDI